MDWWKRDDPNGGLEAQATGPSSPTCASATQTTRLVGFFDITATAWQGCKSQATRGLTLQPNGGGRYHC